MANQGNYKQFQDEDVSVDSGGSDSILKPDAKAYKNENNIEMVEVDIRHTQGSYKRRVPGVLCSKACLISLVILVIILILFTFLALIIKSGKPSNEGPYIDKNFPWKDIRLPTSAIPISYEIFLHPNLNMSTVVGNETIQLKATSSFDFIVIHMKRIEVTDIKFRLLSPKENVNIASNITSEKQEMLYIKLDRKVLQGRHCELQLKFNYTLSDKVLTGFYKSYYTENGEKKPMASTQFEPTDARAAFPCFDEPALKAMFTLAITHTKEHLVLSNMPKVKENIPYELEPNYVVDHFNQSVVMSSYLVAFVVCGFESIKSVTSSGTKVAVYASPDQIDQTHLALEILNTTVPFYEEYYDVKYPLPKQDMIAIPDFQAGAMENWGLITYRESSLLYKENISASFTVQWIVLTITHELAHQWFGNLVTMQWWNDLWLNEGFASFMEYVGTDNARPEWKMMEQFSYQTTQGALVLDSLSNSHPLSVDVQHPNEISSIFDSITYNKGAAIIRMVQDFLTEDTFRKGVNLYLKRHMFQNSVTSDLWKALSDKKNEELTSTTKESPINVTELMDYWTLQMGYPVVTFTRIGQTVNITQEQFLINPNGKPAEASKFGYKWMIPLTYFHGTEGSSSDVKRDMVYPNQVKTITLQPHMVWIKGNSQRSGVYRVNYDLNNWKQLLKILNNDHTLLPPGDRSSLIDDAFHLARAGLLDLEVALNLTRYLRQEVEYVPMATALDNIAYIGSMLQTKGAYDDYTTYVMDLLKPIREKLGLEDSGEHLKKLLRGKLIMHLLNLGDDETLKWAYKNFQTWMQSGKIGVGANLAYVVYCGGIKYGHLDEWNFAWEQLKNTTIASHTRQLQSALACTQDPTLLHRYLYWSLDPEKIRKQNLVSVISSVASNPTGFHYAMVFVVDNWDKLLEMLGEGVFELNRLFGSVTSGITSEFDFMQLKKFLMDQFDSAKSGQRKVLQSIEVMETNIGFLKKNEEKLTAWFKREVQNLPAA